MGLAGLLLLQLINRQQSFIPCGENVCFGRWSLWHHVLQGNFPPQSWEPWLIWDLRCFKYRANLVTVFILIASSLKIWVNIDVAAMHRDGLLVPLANYSLLWLGLWDLWWGKVSPQHCRGWDWSRDRLREKQRAPPLRWSPSWETHWDRVGLWPEGKDAASPSPDYLALQYFHRSDKIKSSCCNGKASEGLDQFAQAKLWSSTSG